jgi:hypothetical protein
MKLTSTILTDFIRDFEMERFEFGVCFEGIINFNLPDHNFNLYSEVHMEAGLCRRIDSIYLLNPVIALYKMPTFFNDVDHKFLYLHRKGIIITGILTLIGPYSVSIFPSSRTVSQHCFDELRARKLN